MNKWGLSAVVVIGLSVAAHAQCGPPNYSCAQNSTAVSPVTAAPSLPSINSTGYAYIHSYDFYAPKSVHGNCYTALTDSSDRGGKSIHASWSGGGGNNMPDVNRAYLAATDDGGALLYFHVHYDANGCMQRDSDMNTNSPSGGSAGGFTASRVTPGRAYKISSKDGTKSGLYQEDLTGISTVTVTRTLLFDYNNCPGVDGTKTTQGGNGNLNVDSNDRFYSTTLNFPPAAAGQDNAHWALVWDRQTNSCTTYYSGVTPNVGENPASGNVWTWCTGPCSQHGSNPAPLAFNTFCDPLGYGVHDSIQTMNGIYMNITGKCINGQTGQSVLWRFGANDIRQCSLTVNNCGGHGAFGYNTIWTANLNLAHRDASDLTTFTIVHPSLNVDMHGAANWIGPAADVNPWINSTQPGVISDSCAGLVYCYELIAIRLDGTIGRFGPSFHQWTGAANDLGPIPAITQDGYCIVFESSWNGTRGLDASGNFRKDLFSICNLDGAMVTTPSRLTGRVQ